MTVVVELRISDANIKFMEGFNSQELWFIHKYLGKYYNFVVNLGLSKNKSSPEVLKNRFRLH